MTKLRKYEIDALTNQVQKEIEKENEKVLSNARNKQKINSEYERIYKRCKVDDMKELELEIEQLESELSKLRKKAYKIVPNLKRYGGFNTDDIIKSIKAKANQKVCIISANSNDISDLLIITSMQGSNDIIKDVIAVLKTNS